MGTFLLKETKVNQKEKENTFGGWYEKVTVELEFVSNGDTSDFSTEEIMHLIIEKLREIKK